MIKSFVRAIVNLVVRIGNRPLGFSFMIEKRPVLGLGENKTYSLDELGIDSLTCGAHDDDGEGGRLFRGRAETGAGEGVCRAGPFRGCGRP